MKRIRKPEGELVNNHTFGIGVHVNPTAQYMEEKGIHSPAKWKHYATATNYKAKTQLWFKTPERLEMWRKTTLEIQLQDWTIKINETHGRSANVQNEA